MFPTAGLPAAQLQPAWSKNWVLAYRDQGVTCVRNDGAFFADPARVGLWFLDCMSGESWRVSATANSPSWSADGTKLAYMDAGRIMIADARGQNARAVLSGGSFFYPALSPDGSVLAFDADWGSSGPYRVWLARSDGSDPRPLGLATSGSQRMACWNPSGNSLICVAYPDTTPGQAQIFEAASDGSWWRQVTSSRGDKLGPQYSPNGDRIMFTVVEPGVLPQLWSVRADGDSLRQITHYGASSGSWAPTGSAVAYAGLSMKNPAPGMPLLWRKDLITGQDSALTAPWPQECP